MPEMTTLTAHRPPAKMSIPRRVIQPIIARDVPGRFYQDHCQHQKTPYSDVLIGTFGPPSANVYAKLDQTDPRRSSISFFFGSPFVPGAKLILEAKASPEGCLRVTYELCSPGIDSEIMKTLRSFCEEPLADFIRANSEAL